MNDQNLTSEELEIIKIKKDEKVKRALKECGKKPDIPEEKVVQTRDKSLLGIYLIIFISAAILYFLFGLESLPIGGKFIPLLQKIMVCVMMIMLVLSINRLLKALFQKKIDDDVTVYNLKRLIDLGAAIIIFFIGLSLLFTNWYGAMVSFGIVSLILGLALQNPITSFFAWVFILIRKPYEIGDRIKIGNSTGDVVELGYFDTTLWEFGGEYITGDHPSGRIIRFANSSIFSQHIYNYSWPIFPYIWNELKFYVSYQSDFEFITETAKAVVKEEIGEEMSKRINRYRRILDETPVKELQVKENASVSFNPTDNTWIQVVVRYLVEPKESGSVKKRLFDHLIKTLKERPENVLFP